MTKRELLKKLENLLESKGMRKIENFNGKIGTSSTKATLEDAIKCLEASDNEMASCLDVVESAMPNTYEVIVSNGNWLTHSYNRYYVYECAHIILK